MASNDNEDGSSAENARRCPSPSPGGLASSPDTSHRNTSTYESEGSSIYGGKLMKKCCLCIVCSFFGSPLLLCLLLYTSSYFSTKRKRTFVMNIASHPGLALSLNKSVKPCDNFYRFVCGGWIHQHPHQTSVPEQVINSYSGQHANLLKAPFSSATGITNNKFIRGVCIRNGSSLVSWG